MHDGSRRPVVVGVGRITRKGPDKGQPPALHEFVGEAVRMALRDAAAESRATVEAVAECIDYVACPGRMGDLILNVPGYFNKDAGKYKKRSTLYPNFPGSVASAAGCSRVRYFLDTPVSGAMPQSLVNSLADRIVRGEVDGGVIAGGEMISTIQRYFGKWKKLTYWAHDPGVPVTELGDEGAPELGEMEWKHAANIPIAVYPLFENALRRSLGRTREDHLQRLAAMCEGMSKVASSEANAAHSITNTPLTGQEIVTPTPRNRLVAYPYTKFMVANPSVDMAAAVVVMSEAAALKLGIPPHRMVHLHGCGDGNDPRTVLKREPLHRSIVLEHALGEAFGTLGWSLPDAPKRIDLFDLYTCFPISAGMAAHALHLDQEKGDRLTLIGGLPLHGGPGANTATHSICAMVEALRKSPGKYGLVYANGGMMTKHSVGIYSCQRPTVPWRRGLVPAAKLEQLPVVELDEAPEGVGVVETYTVVHGGFGSDTTWSIVVGSLGGRRFVAVSKDPAVCEYATRNEMLGARVSVATVDGVGQWKLPSDAKL